VSYGESGIERVGTVNYTLLIDYLVFRPIVGIEVWPMLLEKRTNPY
jgi:hypothetical protein